MNAPVLPEDALLDALAQERANGKSIAFANGCFDVLHVGHIRYLQDAARLANYAAGLVVMKRGTATISPAELRHALQNDKRTAKNE